LSNHQPDLLSPITKPCPLVTHPTSRGEYSTTALGNLSQWLTTPSVNKSVITSNINLTWCNLRLFPHVLSLATWENRLALSLLQLPYRKLYRVMRSPLRLLFSRLNSPSSSTLHMRCFPLKSPPTLIQINNSAQCDCFSKLNEDALNPLTHW